MEKKIKKKLKIKKKKKRFHCAAPRYMEEDRSKISELTVRDNTLYYGIGVKTVWYGMYGMVRMLRSLVWSRG